MPRVDTLKIIMIMNLLKTFARFSDETNCEMYQIPNEMPNSLNRKSEKLKNTNKRLALIIRSIYNLIARYELKVLVARKQAEEETNKLT